MWDVLYRRDAAKRIRKFPPHVREKLDVWTQIVEQQGPTGLREFSGFNDEALTGAWAGYRSSRLNRQYRVIYLIEEETVCVLVFDVTAHDYRRK